MSYDYVCINQMVNKKYDEPFTKEDLDYLVDRFIELMESMGYEAFGTFEMMSEEKSVAYQIPSGGIV